MEVPRPQRSHHTRSQRSLLTRMMSMGVLRPQHTQSQRQKNLTRHLKNLPINLNLITDLNPSPSQSTNLAHALSINPDLSINLDPNINQSQNPSQHIIKDQLTSPDPISLGTNQGHHISLLLTMLQLQLLHPLTLLQQKRL